jgi:hypothetical protein
MSSSPRPAGVGTAMPSVRERHYLSAAAPAAKKEFADTAVVQKNMHLP